MKQHTMFCAGLVAGALLFAAGCSPDGNDATVAEAEAPIGDVVATVNGNAITSTQYDIYALRRGDTPQTEQARLDLINDLVSIELLSQAAQAHNLHRDPEIAGTLVMQRNAALAQAAIRKHLEDNPITDEDLQAEYHRYLEDGGSEEIRASHILVEDAGEARALIGEIDGGADFAGLAEAHSIDTGSGARGGDLGWFEPEMMVDEFASALRGLDTGEMTREPVQSRFGWHIIRLDDRRAGEPMPFEELRDEIHGYLQSQAIEAWVNELRESANVEIR